VSISHDDLPFSRRPGPPERTVTRITTLTTGRQRLGKSTRGAYDLPVVRIGMVIDVPRFLLTPCSFTDICHGVLGTAALRGIGPCKGRPNFVPLKRRRAWS
jgi:hypothetical protein